MNIVNSDALGFINMINENSGLHFANIKATVASNTSDATPYETPKYDSDCSVRINSNLITVPNKKEALFQHEGTFNFILIFASGTLRKPQGYTSSTNNQYIQLYREEFIEGVSTGRREISRIRTQGVEDNNFHSFCINGAWSADVPKNENVVYKYFIEKQAFLEISELTFSIIGFTNGISD